MAKILYGLCGEGLGHASRSRILINYLKKKHDIRIVAGGKAFSYMSKEFDYVYEIESPHFVYKGNEVKILLTIIRMITQTFVKSSFSYFKVRRIIKEFKPDILITDAEPISFFASFSSGIKRISIDNQQALIYRDYKVKYGEYFPWFALLIMIKLSILGADKYIIYDFFDEQIEDEKILFVKPLIQDGILKQKPTHGNHIFVYQTSISSEYICNILKNIDEQFIIYGFDKELIDGNLIFKKFNDKEFYQDISCSKAIITNGGFTVISEALYLKKPIFSIPIKKQFEQVLNGKFVEKLGAGIYKNDFYQNDLEYFLQNLESYKKNLKSYKPGNQKDTFQIIDDQIQSYSS